MNVRNDIDTKDIVALCTQGLTERVIAKKLGCSESLVHHRLSKVGGVLKPEKPKKEKRQRPKPSATGYGKIKPYTMTPDEIERRYGPPGAYAEKRPYILGWKEGEL